MARATNAVPENHPVRSLFRTMTKRGLDQINLCDAEAVAYIGDLMAEFVRTDSMYLRDREGQRLEHVTDILAAAEQASDPEVRRGRYKHLGDLTLFMLGLFPERFAHPRRSISADYYAQQGRRSYRIVAELDPGRGDPALYRRLADRFEQYVTGLNWVKLYTEDPFLPVHVPGVRHIRKVGWARGNLKR